MHSHTTHTPAAEPPIHVQVVGQHTPVVEQVVAFLRNHGTGVVAVSTELGRSLAALRKQRFLARQRQFIARMKEGKAHWRGGGIHHLRRFDHPRGPDVYLVNCLREDGTSSPVEVTRAVTSIRKRSTGVPIIALIDETNPDALRAARQAGATSFIGAREAENEEAVSWRVWESRSPGQGEVVAPATASAPAKPSPREVAEAIAAVNAAVSILPSPADRLARTVEWASVDAPQLRDAGSGRFDAKRIASTLGISLARLAPAAGVSQQALSAKPDSPRAQAGLRSIARVLAALDELLPAEQQRMWLNTPRAQFQGRTPLALIEAGEAEALARAVEGALEGHPG